MTSRIPRRSFLWLLLALAPAAAGAQQPQRSAKEYIKTLEDPHRVERLKPDEVIRTLALKPGDVVADIGSGSGLFTRPMARAVAPGGKVYAVDIDRELLEHVARTAAEQKIGNITTVLAEKDSPGLAPESIDLAFICDTLHHIEKRAAYLAAVKPALRPGGRLAIIDFSTSWPSGHEALRYSVADLERWAAEAGYVKAAEYSIVPGNFFHVYALKESRAPERIDAEMIVRLRDEGMYRSEIMRTMHFLTDVYGPRLTGSPNLKAAGEWAIRRMKEWGLENGHLEPWDFGHPGWLNERLTAHIVSPVKDALVCEVLAWTPGTQGVVRAPVALLALPERPTAQELQSFLASARDRIAGKIVLLGKHVAVPVTLNPPPRRRDEAQLRAAYDPNNPNAGQLFGRPRRAEERPDPSRLTTAQVTEAADIFLVAARVPVKVLDAGREHGQVRAFSNRTYDPEKAVPTVVMRNEDYGRITRILSDGTQVELEFEIVNRVYPEGRTAYNTIAEIPGSDRRQEVIMLGAHLDSWHAATGATDNAIGCAVMMEAARILKAAGVRPRRTVRIALWSGEEQGLLGSQAYVKEHFGTFEEPKAEFQTFGGYLNIDSGTGRARGASVFGPPEAATILRQILQPLEDLGVVGAIATRSRRTGGTDSTSFNHAGLPGIGLGQDPIEYGTYTWHTNLDTYERIIEEDAKASAITVACAVYHLALRDGLLPRFTRDTMPPSPTRSETSQ